MKTFTSLEQFSPTKKTVITIGTFDGVHLGHKKIIEKVVQSAKLENLESLVLTFFPHPRMVLHKNSDIKLLNTISEKQELLQNLGLNNLMIHAFDKHFSELSPEEFVLEILIKKLNIQKIIIGYDHRFGKNRSAGIDDLILLSKKYNFEVEQISAQELNEIAISSTIIRNAISDGNIILANKYLGYNYFFSGKIVQGKQLGRTINFATANIKIEEEYKQIPKTGVYVVKSKIYSKSYFGMMNIGNRPTVDGKNQTIEVHFFDFDDDIYDQNLTVEVLDFLRDEQKFESVEHLKNQLEKDKLKSLAFFDL